MSLTPTTKLGPYEIIVPLGAGGMGEVYRARDTRLDREVAVKVMPDRVANDPLMSARFQREAKVVAALSHPNVLAVYDVGQQDGVAYVVTELLEGETLRQAMLEGSLPTRKAIEVAVAVADGLAAAHARGVIHRDLKPENIFLTTDGVVKILDFGLARMENEVQSTADAAHTPTVTLNTSPGTVLGTINYMSPEQIRAQKTDARSDVFSFGCVLYEMLTGERAFQGETSADTMTAILREPPKSVRSGRRNIGMELERVIERCLEKKPEARFQSSQDLAFTLRSILADSGSRAAHDPPGKSAARGFVTTLVIVALVAAGGAYFVIRNDLAGSKTESRAPIASIAVLPLENVSRDSEQEYFVDGMTDALISDLAKIGGLKVISRTSVMRYKGTARSLPEIARELKVDAVIEGSVLRDGDRVRITAQLIRAATDEHLWSESYDRDLRDVLRLQSEVARTIAQEVKVTLTPQVQARMADARPVNPEAYQAYLKGRFYWNKRTSDGLQKAIEYFERAVSLDPEWPLGHLGLADAYILMPVFAHMRPDDAMPKAKKSAVKALELDRLLGEAHATLGWIANLYDRDWRAAEQEFERALTLEPNYPTAHQWYAEYLAPRVGRHREAIQEITKAQELDPLSLIIGSSVGWVHYVAGNTEQAETQLRRTLELGPDFARAHNILARVLASQQRFAEAITEAREAVRLSNNDPLYAATLGYACAKANQPDEARRILDELGVQSTKTYIFPTQIALVHAGLDQRDQMFESLERAYQERDVWLLYTLIDPLLAPMRGDPRFVDLARRADLSPLTPTPPERSSTKPPTGKIMLAVLPFENLSRDPEQEFFSDGLTEEMITQLGRLNPQALGVIARSSSMHYKNTDRTIEHVRKELGVDYVVEGSVRRAGERVRITATLIQCSDQAQLWTDSFERELKDVLGLQSEVAQAIAGEIKVKLTPQEQARVVAERPVNPEAYQAYLKGRFHWNKRTSDGLKKALEFFERTVGLDPDWALGYAGLADTYALMPYYSLIRPREAIPKAKAAAAKALEIDESLAEAHASLALIATNYDWNWSVAEREFQHALALSPNYATAYHWYERHLLTMGRYDEAIKAITKAQTLDPLSLIISVNVGGAHHFAGDFKQAETLLRQTIELGPDWAVAHRELAITLLAQGKLAEATTEAREAVRLSGNEPHQAAILGYACAMAGQSEEAQRILKELAAHSTQAYVAPSLLALVHAGADERNRMFEWLEKAYEERDTLLPYILCDPLLAPMRSDSRFTDLVRRVGLPALTPNPPESSFAKPAAERLRLAVLPFVNDSSDPELDYLSDGIAETLINGFSRIESLTTVPRSTAFRHKGTTEDPVQVGRKISATAVLTGRVLKRGDQLTIQAELTDVAEGRQLWGERYQKKFADLVEIERDIAKEITDALRLRLTGEEQKGLSRGYSQNAEAYRLYLQSRFWWSKRTKEGFDQALRLLNEAVQIDPNFALAYSGIADTYSLLPLYGLMRPHDARTNARAAAEKALRLDDALAEAHSSMGMVYFYLDWEFAKADIEFARAQSLNPRYATTQQWSGLCIGVRGRIAEAKTKLRRAIELEPLMPILTHNLAWMHMWEHDWNESLTIARSGLEFAPEFPWLNQSVGLSLLALDRQDEAIPLLRRSVDLAGSASFANSYLAYGLGRSGRKAECQEVIDEWLELNKWRYVPPTDIAIMYMGLGDTDEAINWLEKGLEERDVWMTFLSVLPFWDPLRDDPRFVSLLKRVGLPDLRKPQPTGEPSKTGPSP